MRIWTIIGLLALSVLINACEDGKGTPDIAKTPHLSGNYHAAYEKPGLKRSAQLTIPKEFELLIEPAFKIHVDEALGVPSFLFASKAASGARATSHGATNLRSSTST